MRDEIGRQPRQLGVAARQHDDHQIEVHQEDPAAEEEDRQVDRARGDAEGAHGDDLGVGREAADRDQDAEEQRHRNGEDDDPRQREQEQLDHRGDRERAADDQARQLEELPHEDDRGVEDEPERGRADHLFEDVAREDLHDVAEGL